MHGPTRRPGPPNEPPAAKRQRKAINCEPCRSSKLKCDRNRPCSSCVLRGTTAQCYQGADAALYRPPPPPQPVTASPTIPTSNASTSAHHDQNFYFEQIRQAVSALQAMNTSQTAAESTSTRGRGRGPDGRSEVPSHALGRTEGEGLYAGPTTLAAHLMSSGTTYSLHDGVRSNTTQRSRSSGARAYDADSDLLKELPHLSVVDGLIDYYFDYCSWLFKHIDSVAFAARWQEYKASPSSNYSRLLLAMEAIICAIAIHYLPPQHELARSLDLFLSGDELGRRGSLSREPRNDRSGLLTSSRSDELGVRWYNVCRAALAREQAERRTYSLDVVETLLARSHFLTLTKIDTEEIWAVRGELVTIATAMGLHRDPGSKMPPYVAERRRWAWWHIMTMERWQCFMQGRPLAISPDHYDTKFPSAGPTPLPCSRHFSTRLSHPSPSQIDTSPPSPPAVLRTPESIASPSSIGGPQSDGPAPDESISDVEEREEPSTRTYEAHTALFRLASILGDIMMDAVRLTPVNYDRVIRHDNALADWLETLPDGLKIAPSQIAQDLCSFVTGSRRQATQALFLRMSTLHIRFTLHRPYATQVVGLSRPGAHGGETPAGQGKDEREFSLMVALQAAKELIDLVAVAAPGDALAIPGHLNWAPVHLFSATMFLIFTIVNSPASPNASPQPMDIDRDVRPLLFSAHARIPHIERAMNTLRRVAFLPTANKALDVLEALAPFYHIDYINASAAERERIKHDVLPRVQSMGLPYHEGGTLSVVGGSDGGRDDGRAELPRPRVGSSASPQTLPPLSSLSLHSDYPPPGDGRGGGMRRIPTPGVTPPPSWTNSHAREYMARAGESSDWRADPSRSGQEEAWNENYPSHGARLQDRRASTGMLRPVEDWGPNVAQSSSASGSHTAYPSTSAPRFPPQNTGYWDTSRPPSQTASAFPHDVGDPPAAAQKLPALTWTQPIVGSNPAAQGPPFEWAPNAQAGSYSHLRTSPSNDAGVASVPYPGGQQPAWSFDLPQMNGGNVWPPQQTQATGWVPSAADDSTPAQSGGFGHEMPGLSGMRSFSGFGFSDAEMQLMLGDQVTPTGSGYAPTVTQNGYTA